MNVLCIMSMLSDRPGVDFAEVHSCYRRSAASPPLPPARQTPLVCRKARGFDGSLHAIAEQSIKVLIVETPIRA